MLRRGFIPLVTLLGCANFWLAPGCSTNGSMLDALLLSLFVMLTLIPLNQKLPAQNIVMAAGLIAGLAGVAASLSPGFGRPFGHISYSDRLQLFDAVLWPIPLLWIVVILNAREVARLCLRRWRRTNFYGFWLMGLAAALGVVFDLSLEPFAVKVRSYWSFPKMSPAGQAAPWMHFLGWFVFALGLLVCLAPWLIEKRPVPEPKNHLPLSVWLAANCYLTVGNAKQELWGAVLLSLFANGIIAWMATRGAFLREA